MNYLTLVNGIKTLTRAIQSSSGSTSAGQIIAANGAGKIDFSFAPNVPVKVVSASITLTSQDFFVNVQAPVNVTLPDAVTNRGKVLVIKITTPELVTINPGVANQLIDNTNLLQINRLNTSISLVSDGQNWHII